MNNLVKILPFLLATLPGCEDQAPVDITSQVIFLESFPVTYSITWCRDQEIIASDQEYQEFGERTRIRPAGSQPQNLPEIDFSLYILVGKLTQGGGCRANYARKVIDCGDKLIYRIRTEYAGDCKMEILSMNWVLVPKSFIEYEIEYQITDESEDSIL
jgi:hypothetical protein